MTTSSTKKVSFPYYFDPNNKENTVQNIRLSNITTTGPIKVLIDDECIAEGTAPLQEDGCTQMLNVAVDYNHFMGEICLSHNLFKSEFFDNAQCKAVLCKPHKNSFVVSFLMPSTSCC